MIHSALDAYCELHGSEAKLLQGVLTCTAEPWWWDRSKCSHGPELPCSGPRGCRVLESVAEEQLVRVYSRLGHTSTYERAVLEQGKYEAGRLRNYVAKLARYPGKVEGAAEFLFRHTGERVFYVAPWLSRLGRDDDSRSAVVGSKRLLRDAEDDGAAGAARARLLGPVVAAPNAP